MENKSKPQFLDWSISATNQWSDEEMSWLRNENPSEMVEPLWGAGRSVQNFALMEMVAHGNYRKAAALSRAMVSAHPECKRSISEDCGPDMAKILLEENLLKLPSKPSEIKH